jgi:hypothetical protein
MKMLMPCELKKGSEPEFAIQAQNKITDLVTYVEQHLPCSPERANALNKLEEASHWIAVTASE